MTMISATIKCFVCGKDHGKFHSWDGPDICCGCKEELLVAGQQVKAISTGRSPIVVTLANGEAAPFMSLSQVREAVIATQREQHQKVGDMWEPS